MTSLDACVRVHPRGRGASGLLPCALVEVWAWSLEGGAPRVTFAGQGPRGEPGWAAAVWRAVAAEALCVAEEAEGTRAIGQR